MRKRLLLCSLLLTSAFALTAQISIRIGPPPAPRIIAVRPNSPGPGYNWVGGYWYPNAGRYRWHAGYWTRPPYQGARWVEPRHDGQQYYNGYWDGDHGRIEHDHRWDRGHDRDYRP